MAVSAAADSANGPQTVVRQTAELNGDAAVFECEKDRHEQVSTPTRRAETTTTTTVVGFNFFFSSSRAEDDQAATRGLRRRRRRTGVYHRPDERTRCRLTGPNDLSLGVSCARSYNCTLRTCHDGFTTNSSCPSEPPIGTYAFSALALAATRLRASCVGTVAFSRPKWRTCVFSQRYGIESAGLYGALREKTLVDPIPSYLTVSVSLNLGNVDCKTVCSYRTLKREINVSAYVLYMTI